MNRPTVESQGQDLISIIIPAYNVESFIQETIESVRRQSYKNFECVIIDDGSTDETYRKIVDSVDRDIRFKVIRTKNQGVSAARNLGIRESNGTYLLFLDSDDLLFQDSIRDLYEAATLQKADFVYGKIKRLYDQREWYIQGHIDNGLYSDGEKNIIQNTELFYSIGPGAKLVLKDLLMGVKFPETIGFGEDQVVTFYLLTNAKKIYCVDKDVYKYRVRNTRDSLTQSMYVNAHMYLKWLIEVTRINKKEIFFNDLFSTDEKEYIIAAYLDRLLKYEVYPIFKKTLKSNKKQDKAFFLLNQWLDGIPEKVKKNMVFMEGLLIFDLNKYISLVKKKNYISLEQITNKTTKIPKENINNDLSNALEYRKKLINATTLTRLSRKLKGLWNLFLEWTRFKNKAAALTFYLMQLLPIKRNLVVFAKSKKTSPNDNIKILFKKYHNINRNAVIISNFGEASVIQNMKYHYFLSRAKVIIVDDYFYPLYSKKLKDTQHYIQVWHAVGALKKFGFEAVEKIDSKGIQFEQRAHQQYTHVISSSPFVSTVYKESFLLNESNVLSLGSAKTDVYFQEDYKIRIKERFYKKHPELLGKKLILYAPTFRGNEHKRKIFNDPIEWDNVMIPENCAIIYRFHPIVSKVNSKIKNIGIGIQNDFTTTDLIIISSIIISDFSSIYFEAIIAKKPFVFFFEEIENYSKERGMTYLPQKSNGDFIVYNEKELNLELSNIAENKFTPSNMSNVYNKYLINCDGHSADRIIKLIEEVRLEK